MLFVDRDTHVLSRLAELRVPLALCALMVLGSFLLRYQRWYYMLRTQGHQVPWREGLRAYIAGFAFTASPGKAGELLRIRYFGDLNVPAHTVLATFIAERALDLLIITLLGVGAAALIPAFGILTTLVAGCLALLYLAGRWPWLLRQNSCLRARLDAPPGRVHGGRGSRRGPAAGSTRCTTRPAAGYTGVAADRAGIRRPLLRPRFVHELATFVGHLSHRYAGWCRIFRSGRRWDHRRRHRPDVE